MAKKPLPMEVSNPPDYDELAKESAGNWMKFDSFGWHDQPDNAEDWMIVHTDNRDSGITEKSNAAAIAEMLSDARFRQTVIPQHFGHWACGWVDGYAIKVYTSRKPKSGKREVTLAFKCWCNIQVALDHYCVLDDEGLTNLEYEETLSNIGMAITKDMLNGKEPENWKEQVYRWLWDHGNELENKDDQGGWPSDEGSEECLLELGWLNEDRLLPVMARLGKDDDYQREKILEVCRETGDDPHDWCEWLFPEPVDPYALWIDLEKGVSAVTADLPFDWRNA